MIKIEDLTKEVTIQAVCSSGKGGQHVNKVSTKAEVYFDIDASASFTPDEKYMLKQKLSNRVSHEHVIRVSCQESRSLFKNKETAIAKLYDLFEKALTPVKPRTKTKPTKASKEKRLREKGEKSLKKFLRKKGIDYSH